MKCNPHSLDTAMSRWSVMCIVWHDLSAGSHPQLGPFLAGYFCRIMGASMPDELGTFRDSFRVGWREADSMVAIDEQSQPPTPE